MHASRKVKSKQRRSTGPKEPRRRCSCMTTRTVFRASAREVSLMGVSADESTGLAGVVIGQQAYTIQALRHIIFGVIFDLRRRWISLSCDLPRGQQRRQPGERCGGKT